MRSAALCNTVASLYVSFRLPLEDGTWLHITHFRWLRASDQKTPLCPCLKLELGPNVSPNDKQPWYTRAFQDHYTFANVVSDES
jgi:hypothetical protein